MTDRDLTELRELLQKMPLADLVEAKKLMSDELNARYGKTKYEPPIHASWDDIMTR